MRYAAFTIVKSVVATTVVAAALLAVMEESAHADDTASTVAIAPPAERTTIVFSPPAPPPPASHWYGWQTLAADGGSLALTATGLSVQSGVVSGVGVAGIGLGGPIVHAAHGHWRLAAADLGLRVGSVAVGAVVGYAIGAATSPPPSQCEGLAQLGCSLDRSVGTLAGATVGAITASVIDAAVLARETVPAKEPPPAAFTWSPSVGMLKNGGSAGVTGTF